MAIGPSKLSSFEPSLVCVIPFLEFHKGICETEVKETETGIFIQVRVPELSVLTRSQQQGSLPPRVRARRDQRQRNVSPISIRRYRRGLAVPISEVDIRRLVLAYVGLYVVSMTLTVAPDFNANEQIHILNRIPWSNFYRAHVTVLDEFRDNARLPLSASCEYLKGLSESISDVNQERSDKALSALGVPSRSSLRFLGGLVKTSYLDHLRLRCERLLRTVSRTSEHVESSLKHQWRLPVREIAMYWLEDQRTSRIISRTPMEVAVQEIATYWFKDQRTCRIISQTSMEVAVREIATYWFEDQRTCTIISRTPMEVAVREIATYWFED
uniref:Uncharacterized protein n=1 Tax=Oryza sativa subsp. japonica TaxID=39947 RepID=Q60EE0_ORYSJ|nr:hypothetical protein [Oryza sativa Japonica Group]